MRRPFRRGLIRSRRRSPASGAARQRPVSSMPQRQTFASNARKVAAVARPTLEVPAEQALGMTRHWLGSGPIFFRMVWLQPVLRGAAGHSFSERAVEPGRRSALNASSRSDDPQSAVSSNRLPPRRLALNTPFEPCLPQRRARRSKASSI
jgi:hypothetical protein